MKLKRKQVVVVIVVTRFQLLLSMNPVPITKFFFIFPNYVVPVRQRAIAAPAQNLITTF